MADRTPISMLAEWWANRSPAVREYFDIARWAAVIIAVAAAATWFLWFTPLGQPIANWLAN